MGYSSIILRSILFMMRRHYPLQRRAAGLEWSNKLFKRTSLKSKVDAQSFDEHFLFY